MEASLPKLADVILKVKQLQNLSPAEEFVYLVYIEEIPEELVREMIADKITAAQEKPVKLIGGQP